MPEDLGFAIACLNNLGLVHEADELIEGSIDAHKTDFRLLARAAAVYAGVKWNRVALSSPESLNAADIGGGGQWASVAARGSSEIAAVAASGHRTGRER